MKLLCKAPGIDPNTVVSQYGHFPLSWACTYGYTECVRHLLTISSIQVNKIKPDIFNNPETVFDIASHSGHTEIVNMLKNSGGKSAKDLSYK